MAPTPTTIIVVPTATAPEYSGPNKSPANAGFASASASAELVAAAARRRVVSTAVAPAFVSTARVAVDRRVARAPRALATGAGHLADLRPAHPVVFEIRPDRIRSPVVAMPSLPRLSLACVLVAPLLVTRCCAMRLAENETHSASVDAALEPCNPSEFPSLSALRDLPPNARTPLQPLDDWCREVVVHETEEVDWHSCKLCMPGCDGGSSGVLWLHWDTTDGELLVGNEEGWRKNSWSGAQNACLEAQHRQQAHYQHLGSLGSYGKSAGACAGVSMKAVARWHIALLQALGIQRFSAEDDSYFICKEFQTLPIRVASGGLTVYESIYGQGITITGDGCAEKVEDARGPPGCGQDSAARILELTAAAKQSGEDCHGEWAVEARRLLAELSSSCPQVAELSSCKHFEVNVPDASNDWCIP